MANGHLTKEEFLAFPEKERWGWLFDTISPIASDYENYVIIKKFGVGLGSIIVGVVGVGSAVMWVVNHLK